MKALDTIKKVYKNVDMMEKFIEDVHKAVNAIVVAVNNGERILNLGFNLVEKIMELGMTKQEATAVVREVDDHCGWNVLKCQNALRNIIEQHPDDVKGRN